MAKILVVDDDSYLTKIIADALLNQRLAVDVTGDGREARELVRNFTYDLIILDWDLPGITGVEILKEFRRSGNKTPVLMLTGKVSIDHKEIGFESGADDYLTKPFDIRELGMRVKSLLRRATGENDNCLRAGPLILDPDCFTVTRSGIPIKLVRREFSCLELLMRNPNQVFDAETILERIWSHDSEVSTETVRTTLNRLRRKLDVDGEPSIIETIYGVGYRLNR